MSIFLIQPVLQAARSAEKFLLDVLLLTTYYAIPFCVDDIPISAARKTCIENVDEIPISAARKVCVEKIGSVPQDRALLS